jgi:hypothetical protein
VVSYLDKLAQNRDSAPEHAASPVLYLSAKRKKGRSRKSTKKRLTTRGGAREAYKQRSVSRRGSQKRATERTLGTQRKGSKMTKAERRKQSIKNLKKARAAKSRKSGGSGGTRKTRRKAGKRTVALRNLKKAHSVRRKARRAGRKHHVKGYSYKRPAKTVRVRSHMSFEDKPRRRSRKRSGKGRHRVKGHFAMRKGKRVHVRSHMSHETPRKRTRRHGRRKLSMKKSAVAARRRRRSMMEAPKSRRRPRRHHHAASPRRRPRRHHHSRRHSSHRRSGRSRRRGYALENPLDMTELLVGGFTGILGFVSADALDRVLATHALGASAAGKVGTDGKPLYGDTPPTTGAYAGLYNATAILAPMGIARWGAGLGITVAPFLLTIWVKNPVGRSALQFFGFGAGVRIFGKAVDDLFGYLFGRTSWGARMWDGESRARVLKDTSGTGTDSSGNNVLANYPTTGLGAQPGCGCINCTTGVGACCRMTGSKALPPPAGVPQAPGQPANTVTPTPQLPAPPYTPMFPAPPPTQLVSAPPPPPMVTAPPASIPPHGAPMQLPTPPMAPIVAPRVSTPVYGRPPAPYTGTQGTPQNGQRSPYNWGASVDNAAE